MSNVNWLPDCYRKDPDGNHYKILQLNELAVSELRQDIEAVQAVLELKNATGKTLDLYGAMLDQLRGTLNDEQYRYMLLARIGKNHVKGDYQSIMNALVMMFGAKWETITPVDFELVEDNSKPCLVKLMRYPGILEEAGFTVRQMAHMIKALLPICVTLLLQFYSYYEVPIHYDNTVRFRTVFHPRYNLPYLHLDNLWTLGGSRRLNGYDSADTLDFYPVRLRIHSGAKEDIRSAQQLRIKNGFSAEIQEEAALRMQTKAEEDIEIAEQVQIRAGAEYNAEYACYMTKLNKMDGTWKLDGSRKLDGGRYIL